MQGGHSSSGQMGIRKAWLNCASVFQDPSRWGHEVRKDQDIVPLCRWDTLGCLWDGSFERGMSRPAATFGNPCLASAEIFEVDTVECWRVQPPTEEELEEAARQGNSVLDKCAFTSLLQP